MAAVSYSLATTFPRKVLEDNAATVRLIPCATVAAAEGLALSVADAGAAVVCCRAAACLAVARALAFNAHIARTCPSELTLAVLVLVPSCDDVRNAVW